MHRTLKNLLCAAAGSLLLNSGLFAAQLFVDSSSDNFLKNFVSSNWTAEEGLPGNTITDILQDKTGYIYIGTYDGLVRFDGVEFLTINKNLDPKYGFVSTRSLFQDKAGNIWCGSNDEGVYCLKTDGTVTKYTTDDGLPNNSIRAITEDFDGNIWIGTASGIVYITPQQKIELPNGYTRISQGNNILVRSLYCDTAGRIWICTGLENKLYVFSNKIIKRYTNIKKVQNPAVDCVTQDSNGALWFGLATHYAVKIDGETETLYDLGNGKNNSTTVNSITQDSAKNMWFSMDTGIVIFHSGEFSYLDKSNGLGDDKVFKVMEDNEGNKWIATDRGGLGRLTQSKFQTINTSSTVNAIEEDSLRNCFWLGTDSGLLCLKNGDFIENPATKLLKNFRIRDVTFTEDNQLLVSTYGQYGFLIIEPDFSYKIYTKANGLAGDKTRVAIKASDGRIYVGTTNGLSIFEKDGTITTINKDNGISNDYIMCLYEAEDGTIWCGTDGGGVFLLKDNKVIKTLTTEDKLAGNVIFKIQSFNKGEIFITTGTGLTRIKGNDIFSYNSSHKLGVECLFQIIPDYTGTVWITSNAGISSVKYSDLLDVAEGQIKYLNSKNYGHSDGLNTGGVTSTSKSLKDSLGRIWFTLIDGVAIFDPVRVTANSKAPQVVFQEITVDSETYPFDYEPIILEPGTKRLSFKYTAFSYVSPEQLKFKYKLNNFDSLYSDWTNQRTVSYTNLPPGTYEFSVFAQNRDEVLSMPTATVTVIKKPYFWQTWYFKVLTSLLIIFIVASFVISKLVQMRKEQKHLKNFSMEVVQALAGSIDAKDRYTKGHSIRVAKYSQMLSKRLGKSKEEQERIYYSAMLHDIGKIGIPDAIINKPDALTPEEYELVKSHPVIGSEILSSITSIPEIAVGARWHHERFDGAGYPDKLKGKDIPELARIIAVADAYDAMTSNRSYRHLLPQAQVREQIICGKNSQFDPEIAQKMIEIIDEDKDFTLHE